MKPEEAVEIVQKNKMTLDNKPEVVATILSAIHSGYILTDDERTYEQGYSDGFAECLDLNT